MISKSLVLTNGDRMAKKKFSWQTKKTENILLVTFFSMVTRKTLGSFYDNSIMTIFIVTVRIISNSRIK